MHVPFEDKSAVDVAFKFCEFIQPDVIVMHEWHDFYLLSRFSKDPERQGTLQDEIDGVNKYVKKLRKLCPKADFYLLESNHLNRLKKYLWYDARALASLRSLKLEELLNLKEYGVTLREHFSHEGFLFKHGNLIRKYSGYTAKGEFEKEGVSGCTGHTHRLSQYYETKRGGSFTWVESGCLCKILDVEYIEGTANWQQGLALVSFLTGTDHFYAAPIPIINYQIHFGETIVER
tara:strand:+ start:14 stop:712 length:699 start_codon:yes stop_codon:yes gene_type:complete